jgi:tol-pal system protein YbgF
MTRPCLAGLGAALALSFALAGCWVKKDVGERMAADILALQAELQAIKAAQAEQQTALGVRLEAADKKLAELDLAHGETRRSAGRNAADTEVVIEQLKTLLMELRGQFEVTAFRVDKIEKKLNIIHSDLSDQRAESKRREDEARLKSELDARKREADAKKDPLAAIQRPEKQEDFYKLAYGLLEGGQTQAARLLFEEFLSKWPKDGYADNAMYWIAESLYAEGKFREAALAFQRVRQEFPKGDKNSDALLKLGFCFIELKLDREALPFLKEFVASYPGHPLAGKVKQKIKEAEKRLKAKPAKGG